MSKITFKVTATIIANAEEALSKYLKGVDKLYKKVKVEKIEIYKVSTTLLGDNTPNFSAVVTFPNMESVSKVFNSDEYKKLIPYREKAFSKIEAYLCPSVFTDVDSFLK